MGRNKDMNHEQQTSCNRKYKAISLAGFVASSSLMGLLVYVADYVGIIRVLSWSIGPGLSVLAAIGTCAVFVVTRGESIKRTLSVSALLCLPMFLDFIYLRTEVFVTIGIALTVAGCAYLYFTMRTSYIGRYGFWLISAYIQSTYIFNALYVGYGHMSFFGAGYTK